MWGNWSVILLSGVGVVLVALSFSFLGLIFGLVFAVIVIATVIGFFALGRAGGSADGRQPAKPRRDAADVAAAGQPDRGAPAAVDGTPAPPSGALPASPRGPSREA